MKNFFNFLLLCVVTIFISCEKTDLTNQSVSSGYSHGIYVVNEGNYGQNNASVTYINTDSNIVINDVFQKANNRSLGDVAMCLGFAGGKGFIVVNNSYKIECVDLKTFKTVQVITGFTYPRYFLKINDNTAYVTDGNFAGKVYVIDVNMMKKTDSIPVGYGPENMVLVNNNVFVANSGGWGIDSTLSVINPATNKVFTTVKVDAFPTDLVVDANNNVWALCQNYLVCVNGSNFTVLKKIPLLHSSEYYNPHRMAIDQSKTTIYIAEDDGVKAISITALSVPTIPLIARKFYGLDVNPSNGQIFGCNAENYSQKGFVIRYKNTGEIIDSIQVGMIPGSVFFN